MMVQTIFLLAVLCEVISGITVLSRSPQCPVPGRKNAYCVEPERCAQPVHLRYFGYFWRRRGVASFCRPGRSRNARYMVCCLRVYNQNNGNGRNKWNTPTWKVPDNDNNDNVIWNGTEWIDGRSDSHEVENIVTMDPVYTTKCEEYTQVAKDVDAGGGQLFTPMIVGGLRTLPAEFPHMALLGFGTEDNISWRCGGSLISEKFVLTAAHCLYTQDLGDVKFARLGDMDISSDADNDNVQQFTIVRQIKHPAYTGASHYNDIALLELDRPVTFTKYVRPACLPSTEDFSDLRMIATGWGALEYTGSLSNNLMKVNLQYYTLEECKQVFQPQFRLAEGIDGDSQLCAGGGTESKDTCQGDSGGPLQVKTVVSPSVYEIVGITSFGKQCGIVNVPAVYTKVSYFVPWIEQEVWGDV